MNTPVQEVVFNFIWYCCWMVFLCVVLKPRLRLRTTAMILLAAHIPYAVSMTDLPFLTFTRGLAGPLWILVLTAALFRDKWYRKLMALVGIIAAVVFSELLIAGMLTKEQIAGGIPSLDIPLQVTVYMTYFFVGSAVLTALAVIWKRFSSRYPWNLPMGTWAVFFLFPLSQYVLTAGWVRAVSVTGAGVFPILMILLLCLAADVGLLLVLLRTGRNAMLEARSALMEEQLGFQRQYYASLNEQYFTIRKMRHDVENHLTTIRQLLKNGSPEEAEKYAGILLEEQKRSGTGMPCANPAVAAFLTGKRQELENRGIVLRLSAELPQNTGIPDLELITALGNLMDNAAEACEQVGAGSFSVEITRTAPYVVMKTENEAAADGTRARRIPELARGMGTQILEKLAKDYDGSYDFQRQDGHCTARLVLKGESSDDVSDRHL